MIIWWRGGLIDNGMLLRLVDRSLSCQLIWNIHENRARKDDVIVWFQILAEIVDDSIDIGLELELLVSVN